jgi:chemotaxis protein MotB
MSDEALHELIIVKRYEEEEHEHHSSAWKVAHADFMTAMMAFFLIMWLINVTDSQTKRAISEYFNPIRISEGKTDAKGLSDVRSDIDEHLKKTGFGEAPDPNLSAAEGRRGSVVEGEPPPEKQYERSGLADEAVGAATSGTTSEGSGDAEEFAGSSAQSTEAVASAFERTVAEVTAEQGASDAAAARKVAELAADEGESGIHSGAAASALEDALPGSSGVVSEGDDKDREHAAFQDPYALLAKLAEQYSAAHALSIDPIEGDDRPPGVAGGEVDRDPFDPVYWQLAPMRPALVESPDAPGSAETVHVDALPDAAAPVQDRPAIPATGPSASAPPPEMQVDGLTELVAAPLESAQEVVVLGKPAIDPKTVAAGESLAMEISEAVEAVMNADASPQLSVRASDEGILIDLTDDDDFGMFEIGSAIPNAKVVVLMEKIAKVLSERAGGVVVRGFTDARPYRSETYDNWRLSAARAHMAYYMLARGGFDEKRVVAIEGYADRSLFKPEDPLAAENRRIEILLKEAE